MTFFTQGRSFMAGLGLLGAAGSAALACANGGDVNQIAGSGAGSDGSGGDDGAGNDGSGGDDDGGPTSSSGAGASSSASSGSSTSSASASSAASTGSGPSTCNNGVIDPGEACDGSDVAGMQCTDILGAGSTGTITCTATCELDLSGCSPPPSCGNGTIDAGEQCDGNNLGGASCASAAGAGYTGTLSCSGSCNFDLSQCVPPATCGDGNVNPGEQCDGNNLAGQSCASVLGLPSATGSLACQSNCTFETSGCAACGDGKLQGGEQCDDGNAQNGDGCNGCVVVCLGNELQFGSNCYADVTGDTNWNSASANCSSSLGGHLVTITSSAENDFVWLDVMTFADTGPRWIGFSDQSSEGNFAWVTGEGVPFTNWASTEPNDAGANEDCTEFKFYDNEWNDVACSNNRPYICEYEPPVLLP